jgi:hypothetical protein
MRKVCLSWLLLVAVLMAGCGDSQEYVVTGTANTITPPRATERLVMANYDDGKILIFDLADIVEGQINNIAPRQVITGPQTALNYDLAAAGDNAIWFTTENGELLLFADLDNNNGTASLTLAPSLKTISISYDRGRDLLYTDSTNGPSTVAIFDNALQLPNNSNPTRTLSGFAGKVETLTVDPLSDRLYVIVTTGATSHELHVFNNASGLSGDIAGIPHTVTGYELPTPVFGASYDAANDRLWFGEYDDLAPKLQSFFFIDKVSQLGATTTVNSVSSATGDWLWKTLHEARLDRLFVGNASQDPQANGSVYIYNNPGAVPAGNSVTEPDTQIAGPATLIKDVSGMAILR